MNLTLFLWPERGPISPVSLDLLDIFRNRALGGEDPDEDDLQRLEGVIHRHYRMVELGASRAGLLRILATLHHADLFDGVVLRVGGEIAEPPSPVADQIRELEARLRDLDGQLQVERRVKARLEEVVARLTRRLEEATQAMTAAQDASKLAIQRARKEEREAAKAELSPLRADLAVAKRLESSLRATLENRDEEVRSLSDEVERLRAANARGLRTDADGTVTESVPF